MAAKITGIHGAVAPGEPAEDVVKVLEGLLERAKNGDLLGIAYATVSGTGANNWTLGTGWEAAATDGMRYRISAAITMLDHRYTAAILSDE